MTGFGIALLIAFLIFLGLHMGWDRENGNRKKHETSTVEKTPKQKKALAKLKDAKDGLKNADAAVREADRDAAQDALSEGIKPEDMPPTPDQKRALKDRANQKKKVDKAVGELDDADQDAAKAAERGRERAERDRPNRITDPKTGAGKGTGVEVPLNEKGSGSRERDKGVRPLTPGERSRDRKREETDPKIPGWGRRSEVPTGSSKDDKERQRAAEMRDRDRQNGAGADGPPRSSRPTKELQERGAEGDKRKGAEQRDIERSNPAGAGEPPESPRERQDQRNRENERQGRGNEVGPKDKQGMDDAKEREWARRQGADGGPSRSGLPLGRGPTADSVMREAARQGKDGRKGPKTDSASALREAARQGKDGGKGPKTDSASALRDAARQGKGPKAEDDYKAKNDVRSQGGNSAQGSNQADPRGAGKQSIGKRVDGAASEDQKERGKRQREAARKTAQKEEAAEDARRQKERENTKAQKEAARDVGKAEKKLKSAQGALDREKVRAEQDALRNGRDPETQETDEVREARERRDDAKDALEAAKGRQTQASGQPRDEEPRDETGHKKRLDWGRYTLPLLLLLPVLGLLMLNKNGMRSTSTRPSASTFFNEPSIRLTARSNPTGVLGPESPINLGAESVTGAGAALLGIGSTSLHPLSLTMILAAALVGLPHWFDRYRDYPVQTFTRIEYRSAYSQAILVGTLTFIILWKGNIDFALSARTGPTVSRAVHSVQSSIASAAAGGENLVLDAEDALLGKSSDLVGGIIAAVTCICAMLWSASEARSKEKFGSEMFQGGCFLGAAVLGMFLGSA